MKVSILIPVYNRVSLISETIDSAINQSYKNIEIILVDNESTDGTWEILKQYALRDKRIRIFQNNVNIGPVKNWKKCLDYATGVYGKILWSDDLLSPYFIEKTVPFLNNNKNVGFVFTGTEIFIEGTDKKSNCYFIGDTGVYSSNEYINGVLFGRGYPVSPGCALFRIEDLRKNILVDIPNKIGSNFSMHAIGNDLLIYLLTAKDYPKFAFVNERLSFFRAHNNSITISSEKGKIPLYYSLTKAFFVERYRKNLIKKNNVYIMINIIKYYKVSKKYKLNKIEKFYLINKDFSINLIFLIDKIFKLIKFFLRSAGTYI